MVVFDKYGFYFFAGPRRGVSGVWGWGGVLASGVRPGTPTPPRRPPQLGVGGVFGVARRQRATPKQFRPESGSAGGCPPSPTAPARFPLEKPVFDNFEKISKYFPSKKSNN